MPAEFMLGLDLGGTDLKAALVRRDGSLERFGRRPARTLESAEGPFMAMAAAAADLGVPPAAVAAGLGCPGAIDPRSGALMDRTAHLPHWRDLAVARTAAARLGLPVVADNDANLAALAEHRCGAATDARVSLTITLGTGIGCGIVIDGRVFHGARGGAGELGHVPLGHGEVPCPCGVPDCVEPEASGSGLARAASALGWEPLAATVFEHAARGDLRAVAALERFVDRLGAVIATAVDVLDPEVVVIGGGVAEAGEPLLAPLRRAVERYTLPSHRRGLRIVPAALGERAGTVGAGLLAWETLATTPGGRF